MKITKKSFIENMTTNNTIFIGVVKKLLTADEVYCAIQDLLKPDVILNHRTAKARSNSLEFTGGSILDFSQVGKYSFYEYNYPECTVYICCHETYDNFDETYHVKCMYYMVKE